MSDDNDNGESFEEFQGRPDASEGGLTMTETVSYTHLTLPTPPYV